MKTIISIIKAFIADEFWLLAANISFCTLLALIPMGMMAVVIAGYFFGNSIEAYNEVVSLVSKFIPFGKEEFTANLKSVLDNKSSLGMAGVLLLVVASTLLVASIENALDKIFKVQKSRHFFHSRLLAFVVIALSTVLLTLPTVISILEGMLKRFNFNFPLSEIATGQWFFVLMSFLFFVIIVTLIPNYKVYLRFSALGGVLFAFGVWVTRLVYTWYLSFAFTKYNLIYGSFAAVVVLVIWVFYLACLLLFAAEIVAVVQEMVKKGGKVESGNSNAS